VPRKLLFLSAGSGITPIMSMLRALDRSGELGNAVHVHSARSADRVIFAKDLADLDRRRDGYRLHLQLTGTDGRVSPADLDRLCPDWRARQAFASGPRELLDALVDHWAAEGDPALLAMERFQPIIGAAADPGEGGRIVFAKSGIEAESDGATPILLAGEEAGAELPFGCRMGICRTCIGRLCSGEVRDLRTGEIHGTAGEMVRTCVNAPEGPVEIAL
jgi:ferredoxin-NADP reductase